jgi:hypothetical protein
MTSRKKLSQEAMPKFVSWYRRDSYPLIREIMDDKDMFPVDFDEWEKTAESERGDSKARGSHRNP